MGLGTGADLPVSLATISEAATDKNRGAIIGFSNMLWGLGIGVTIIISSVAGGWGRLGGQLLYGHITLVALLVFFGRLTIPESPSWLQARAERSAGVETVRAERTSIRDLVKAPYLLPFVALMLFYALTNIAANTGGQFNTYIAVNIADIPVEVFSRWSLLMFPVGLLAGFWFMRIVDTKWRMTYFVAGGVVLVSGYLAPAVLGFSLPTLVYTLIATGVGGSFAFEGIVKVWTQESFPTMLRASAQGGIISVARVIAALMAVVTPALVDANARLLYGVLSGLVAVGLLIGWAAFHNRARNEFHVEGELEQDVPDTADAQVV